VVNDLIAAGAALNARDDEGLTALARAVREGHTATGAALRKAGGR
jgi:ankyrin repeat protein